MANELINVKNYLDESKQGDILYRSFDVVSKEDKIKLFKVMNGEGKKIKECVNSVIEISDIYCDVAVLKRRQADGSEIEEKAPRIVIIDKDGVTYTAISKGIFNSVRQIVGIFGDCCDWTEPVKAKVVLKSRTKDGQTYNILTLDVIG